ncbi:MAG: acyltransferase, partial [Spartobacteria bacterium]|nr:acyltransferase [Spartobacteria bacterium]
MTSWAMAWEVVSGRLRAVRLRWRGAYLASKVAVGPGCRCWLPRGIVLGERAALEGDVWLKLVAPNARLHVGAFTFFGQGCHLNVLERVDIGAHCLFGPRCVIVDHNHGILPDRRIDEQPCVAKPVRIGDDVWCGAGAVILPGVSIGSGAVVGAQSVVTRDVPPMAVVAGNPARVIRMRNEVD